MGNSRGDPVKIGDIPTQADIMELLEYAPETGIFVWEHRPLEMFNPTKYQQRTCDMWNGKMAGKKAGNFHGAYWVIKILGKSYLASRLAYVIGHGSIPHGSEIDHINKDRLDNRLENLRATSRSENLHNCGLSTNNTSGVKGVCFNAHHDLWIAAITDKGKKIEVGSSKDFATAVRFRYKAEVDYGYVIHNPHSSAYNYLHGATL